MGKEKRELGLEEFVKVCVHEALSLMSVKNERSSSDFYEELCREVCSKFRISEKDFIYLHHSFHWVFFLRDNNSPLEYVQSRISEKENYVKLKRPINEEDEKRIYDEILREHASYIRARINNVLQQVS